MCPLGTLEHSTRDMSYTKEMLLKIAGADCHAAPALDKVMSQWFLTLV